MPKMSGEELVRELRELRAEVPILMLSGYVSIEDSERLATIGLAGVIGKPVFPEELATAVRTTLSQPESGAPEAGPAQASRA
jgi:DNA-binding response OmpR family regulator